MYLGELSPKNLRGAIGIVPQLFITIGILSAQVLGIRNVLGHSTALQRLRGWDDVSEELSEMRLEDQSEKAEGHLSVVSLLSQRSLRWQLVSIIIMNMGQQLSGVNAVFIVEAAGRRLLLLTGFGICCGACVLLTVALNFQVPFLMWSPLRCSGSRPGPLPLWWPAPSTGSPTSQLAWSSLSW
ncbi:unnamed protein product, partial [Lampetra planeri]